MNRTTRFRFWLWLIRVIGVIVPRRLRADWRQEWEAELRYRETLLSRWDNLGRRAKLALLWHSAGAFADALWLQPKRMEDEMFQDLRFGFRMLLKKPGFTLIAVMTLALGIGANTAIFSVVNAVLLRSMPYQKADELVAIYSTNTREEGEGPISPVTYLNLKNQNSVFSEMVAVDVRGWAANLTGDGEPERLQGFKVSANLFHMLGVAPAQGRAFVAEEDRPGNNRVVILSHDIWQRLFGGEADLIGREIDLNGAAYKVIGVMPADFRFYAKTDVWTPLAFTPKDEKFEPKCLYVAARRKSGVSTERARTEVDSLYLRQLNNPKSDSRVNLKPLQASLAQNVKPMLWTLFAASGFVLLIACANVANLLLAHASVRHRELAIRTALGAVRLRVVRQLLVESAMLAVLGGACGLLLAHWGIQFLAGGLPKYLALTNSRVATLKLDAQALGFTFALTFLTTAIFGLLPALQSSKVSLNETLKEGGRGETQGRVQKRLRSLLVVSEIALAMILLVGAGVMLKSFWRLSHVDPGFSPAGALTAQIDPTYKEFDEVVGFYRQLLERVSAIPGVERVGIINSLGSSWDFTIEEHPSTPIEQRSIALHNQVSENYFRALEIPLRAGRFFNDHDVKGAPLVAIIDETLARRHFPNENPIGKHVYFLNASREIVGVIGATKFYSLSREVSPHIYLPYQQDNWWSMTLVVRAQSGDPMNLIPAIRHELAAINPDLPLHSIKLLEDSVTEWSASERFSTYLLAIFAALSALLAAIGIYGVMSYATTQRIHEIGVRMALGAQPRDALKLVLKQGMLLALAGVALGLITSYWLTQLMTKMLFEVSPTDPATFIAIAFLLTGVALLACLIPARRATKVDPLVALRHD
ncbi:MAG TPA: ABC transporter permease [Blastocatellia bacterium]|nr:ABC transporter permease [Blastocatellia bacterium]